MKEEIIEKGKWNDGDINPKNPNLVWVASAAGGKGDWRKVKTAKTPAASAPAAKTPTTPSTTTQAPAPKITYKTKKPADGVVFEVPEEWKTKDPQGQLRTQHRDTFRKLYSDTAKMPDDKLVKILNNKNNNINYVRSNNTKSRNQKISNYCTYYTSASFICLTIIKCYPRRYNVFSVYYQIQK